jgi:hypothetical protein
MSRKFAMPALAIGTGLVLVTLFMSNGGTGRGAEDTPPDADATSEADTTGAGTRGVEPRGDEAAKRRKERPRDDERVVSDAERLDALARAQVWRAPSTPIARARLGRTSETPDSVTCRFRLAALGGTTPKFDCDVEGDKVRIKYGAGPEIPAEAAATRLLRALGFGADEVTLVPRLRCYGCPAEPFVISKVVEVTRAKPLYRHALDFEDSHDFEWVALERKFDARPIEAEQVEGWAFHELDRVEARRGGAPLAHVDALRLMAVLLAHWDNKPENQRLVCLSREWPDGTPCAAPFAMMQDLGGTFGPRKVDLEQWEQTPMFEDRARCVISMRSLPYEGSTFPRVQVSEAGRRHLGGLLAQLSDRQLSDLFSSARFDRKRTLFTDVHPVAEWVRVFKAKVRQITEGPRCPS